jgi:hypothetical protein
MTTKETKLEELGFPPGVGQKDSDASRVLAFPRHSGGGGGGGGGGTWAWIPGGFLVPGFLGLPNLLGDPKLEICHEGGRRPGGFLGRLACQHVGLLVACPLTFRRATAQEQVGERPYTLRVRDWSTRYNK